MKLVILLMFLRIARTTPFNVRETYENCLKKREEKLSNYNVLEIKARGLNARENDSITFKCDVCLTHSRTLDLKWMVIKNFGSTVEIIKNEENKFDATLQITAAQRYDSGQYSCVYGDKIYSVYYLDVIASATRLDLVGESQREDNGKFEIAECNVVFYYAWSHWSACDECDKVGKMTSYGICYVKKLNPNTASKFKSPVLEYFDEGGIPCFASFTPPQIKTVAAGINRTAKARVQLCQVKCPAKKSDFRVGNEKLVEFSGKSLTMDCPGIRNGTVVVWKKVTTKIGKDHLGQTGRGRVTVDFFQRVHFKSLEMTDSGIYSCHIDGRRVATFLLTVIRQKSATIDHAGKAIILVIALVWFCFLVRNN